MFEKRHYFAIIILFLTFSLTVETSYAEFVDASTAKKAAIQKLITMKKQNNYAIKNYLQILDKTKKIPTCYVFTLLPKGFIIVSANTNLSPVLAYSFSNDYNAYISEDKPVDNIFSDEEFVNYFNYEATGSGRNANLQAWEDVNNFDEDDEDYDEEYEQWPKDGTTVTGGWLRENWSQTAPYNDMCPFDPDLPVRSPAGAPAVAMAQILNFYRTTNNTAFDTKDAYVNEEGTKYQFSFDQDYEYYQFPTFTELNSYLSALDNKYKNWEKVSDKDKAALVFACGLANKQFYSDVDLCGTIDAEQTYEAYLKFSCNEASYHNTFYKNVFNEIQEAMKNAHPAHVVFRNEDQDKGCHVVVDGYNTDGYYHVNFGRGGEKNGWYKIDEELQSEYTIINGSILNIMNKSMSVEDNKKVSNLSNYPNPFNESTSIELSEIEGLNLLELTVYDVFGNPVRDFGLLNPGQASIIWDGTNTQGNAVNSGTYIVKLESNGKLIDTKKINFVR